MKETELTKAWTDAAWKALRDTVRTDLPFKETAYFPAERPLALGHRFKARKGEKISVMAKVEPPGTTRCFVDVFEVDPSSGEMERLASAENEPELQFVVRKDRDHIVRVQPELLRSVRITVTVTKNASMAFPVAGHGPGSIRSFFGDARDGGRRKHEGVDVFASKGTPLIAVANGIARAGTNKLGGKVVWLYDQKDGKAVYYAHLDQEHVGMMRRVQIGDTIGTVGNTGNAKHTPPHLHFGIYASDGVADPLPYLSTPEEKPAAIKGDPRLLEVPARVQKKTVEVRRSPNGKAPILVKLPQHTYMEPIAAQGEWYRVQLDGSTGYVQVKDLMAAERTIKKFKLKEPKLLVDAPHGTGASIREIKMNEELNVLALLSDRKFVRTGSGEVGFVMDRSTSSTYP